ncbi:MAG: PEGA domain-containing protein [Planctomycetota bacterium]
MQKSLPNRNRFYEQLPKAGVIITLLVAMLSMGCVRRRLTVRTNPAGASVYVGKQLIGTSPASTSFTYYGDREVEVVADGYRTEKVMRKITPPWYQIPPLDFVSETLWPWEIRDERVIDITMVPAEIPPSEVLQARAEELRLQSSQGIATSIPATFENAPIVFPQAAIQPAPSSGSVLTPSNPGFGPSVLSAPQQNLPSGGGWPQRIPEVGGSYRPPIGNEGF